MQTISLHGKTFHLEGAFPLIGKKIPDAILVNEQLQDVSLSSLWDKPQVIITVPSLDTPTCQKEAKRFHKELAHRTDLHVIVVSMDLPFAQKRWCGSEGIEKIHVFSDFKYQDFAKKFGVRVQELGLLARVVFIVKKEGVLEQIHLVNELSDEPNYARILDQVSK